VNAPGNLSPLVAPDLFIVASSFAFRTQETVPLHRVTTMLSGWLAMGPVT
jgi:hypothetical protein